MGSKLTGTGVKFGSNSTEQTKPVVSVNGEEPDNSGQIQIDVGIQPIENNQWLESGSDGSFEDIGNTWELSRMYRQSFSTSGEHVFFGDDQVRRYSVNCIENFNDGFALAALGTANPHSDTTTPFMITRNYGVTWHHLEGDNQVVNNDKGTNDSFFSVEWADIVKTSRKKFLCHLRSKSTNTVQQGIYIGNITDKIQDLEDWSHAALRDDPIRIELDRVIQYSGGGINNSGWDISSDPNPDWTNPNHPFESHEFIRTYAWSAINNRVYDMVYMGSDKALISFSNTGGGYQDYKNIITGYSDRHDAIVFQGSSLVFSNNSDHNSWTEIQVDTISGETTNQYGQVIPHIIKYANFKNFCYLGQGVILAVANRVVDPQYYGYVGQSHHDGNNGAYSDLKFTEFEKELLLRSEDYGQTWTKIEEYSYNGLMRISSYKHIVSNIINMKNGVVLLILGDGHANSGKIYKSENYGLTFEDTTNNLPSFTDRNVRDIENCDGVLLLSTGNLDGTFGTAGKSSIYRSVNLGESWSQVPISNFGAPKSDDLIKTYSGSKQSSVSDWINNSTSSITTIKYFGGGRVCFGTSELSTASFKSFSFFNSSLGFTNSSNQYAHELKSSQIETAIVYFSPLNTSYTGSIPPSASMVANMTSMYPPHMFEEGQRCVMVVNRYYTYISTTYHWEPYYFLYHKQNGVWTYFDRISGNIAFPWR